MLQSVTECYRVLQSEQSVTECYRLLQSISNRVLQNITEYYRVFLAHLLGPISGLVFLQNQQQPLMIVGHATPIVDKDNFAQP